MSADKRFPSDDGRLCRTNEAKVNTRIPIEKVRRLVDSAFGEKLEKGDFIGKCCMIAWGWQSRRTEIVIALRRCRREVFASDFSRMAAEQKQQGEQDWLAYCRRHEFACPVIIGGWIS